MGLVAASPEANALAAQALYEQGYSCSKVAKQLNVSRATAWRLKHSTLLDPSLIQHVSKTLADKALLGANAAVDTFLDKAENGELAHETPMALAKSASILMQSAGAYAALSGAKDTLSQFVDDFGLQPTHTASKLTITKTQQVVVDLGNNETTSPTSSQTIDIQAVSESGQLT